MTIVTEVGQWPLYSFKSIAYNWQIHLYMYNNKHMPYKKCLYHLQYIMYDILKCIQTIYISIIYIDIAVDTVRPLDQTF